MKFKVLFISCGCLTVTAASQAANPINDTLSWSADLRGGYYTLDRDDRDGSNDVTDEFRARIRLGLEAKLSDSWRAKARFAGRTPPSRTTITSSSSPAPPPPTACAAGIPPSTNSISPTAPMTAGRSPSDACRPSSSWPASPRSPWTATTARTWTSPGPTACASPARATTAGTAISSCSATSGPAPPMSCAPP